MYQPNLGRWLTPDPIEFEAGDNNLYRFVGNNPTNFVDPSGLQGVPVTGGDNAQASTRCLVLRNAGGPVIKDMIVKGLKIDVVDPLKLPKPPDGMNVVGTAGGENKCCSPDKKTLVAARGASPCTSLLLIPDDKTQPFFTFHFTSTCDPGATIDGVGGVDPLGAYLREDTKRKRAKRFEGYSAVFGGCEFQKENPWPAYNLFSETVTSCNASGIPPSKMKYVQADGMLVDCDGNLYYSGPRDANKLRGYQVQDYGPVNPPRPFPGGGR